MPPSDTMTRDFRKFVILFLIRYHQMSKNAGLSSLNMCYLLLSDALNGDPVSKSAIAEQLGVSRAGVDKMMGKTEDLVTVERMPDGQYRLLTTDKGHKYIGRILGGL